MSDPHLHNRIGDAIRDCKKRLFDRLKAGTALEDGLALFIGELRLALDDLVMNR